MYVYVCIGIIDVFIYDVYFTFKLLYIINIIFVEASAQIFVI